MIKHLNLPFLHLALYNQLKSENNTESKIYRSHIQLIYNTVKIATWSVVTNLTVLYKLNYAAGTYL